MSERPQPPRLTAAMAVSAVVHAAAIALVLRAGSITALLDGRSEPAEEAKLIQVSLVSRPGGGGGGPAPGSPSPPSGPPDLVPAPPRPSALTAPALTSPPVPLAPAAAKPRPVPTPTSAAVASLHALVPAPPPAPAATRAVPPVAAATAPAGDQLGSRTPGAGGTGGTQSGGGGSGTGDGSGGDGSDGLAHPAYGSNPKPPYPLAARRLGVEGVVTLEVLVRPDGRPAEVKVRSSSGSSLLDDSAVETVRARWRFIPARRGEVPVESRVTFPIRFTLGAS